MEKNGNFRHNDCKREVDDYLNTVNLVKTGVVRTFKTQFDSQKSFQKISEHLKPFYDTPTSKNCNN